MHKKAAFFALGVIATAGISAWAVAGLNFSNSTGLISVDAVSGTACIVGTAATCMLPITGTMVPGILSSATTISSGNVATSNTFQSVLPSDVTRKGCMITNSSTATILIGLGSSPTLAGAVPVPPNGGQFNCASPAGLVINDQISITSAAAGSAYVVWNQ